MFSVTRTGDRFELTRTTIFPEGGLKADVIMTAPFLRENDDNGPVVAALLRVAGDLLVAEYDAEAHINTARAQAEALGQQLGKAHERAASAPLNVGIIGPLPGFSPGAVHPEATPCPKCGAMTLHGQSCLGCELAAEDIKENAPGGQ